MKKSPREEKIEAAYEAYRKNAVEFDSQPEPIAYCCFIWPHLSRWQAVAAFETHKQLVAAVREHLVRVRREYANDPSPDDNALVGDAVNGVAEMVLQQIEDAPMMGALLAYIGEQMSSKFVVAIIDRSVNRDGVPGSLANVTAMPDAVTTVAQARAYCETHPLIIIAKTKLLEQLAEGPKQKH